MEYQRVFYSRSVPYPGILNIPESSQKKLPAAILCHGHSRQKNDGLDRLAQVLAENGFASFRFDFSGSTGTNGRFDNYPDDWVRVLRDAVTFLSYEERIDAGRIATAGISMGGATVVMAAALEPEIKCTVAMAAPADFGRNFRWMWKEQFGEEGAKELLKLLEEDRKAECTTGVSDFMTNARMCGKNEKEEMEWMIEVCQEYQAGLMNNLYTSLESVNACMKCAPEFYADKINHPILYIHGMADNLIHPDNSRRLYEKTAVSEKELLLVEGCEHNIPMDAKREEVFAKIVKWYQKYL